MTTMTLREFFANCVNGDYAEEAEVVFRFPHLQLAEYAPLEPMLIHNLTEDTHYVILTSTEKVSVAVASFMKLDEFENGINWNIIPLIVGINYHAVKDRHTEVDVSFEYGKILVST